MEELELSAKTVEDAVELALNKLGLSRSEVEVIVLDRGKPGILGLGAREARVKVRPLPHPAEEVDAARIAQEVLESLLTQMKVPATVELKEVPQEEAGQEPAPIALNITGEDLGILIGRRGETLSSLQYMVNLITSRCLKAQAGVTVDVEGYRERRYRALSNLALRLADRVKSTGRSITLEPMPASERRVVHLALRDDPDVITQSIGEGETRQVSISLKRR